MKYTIQNNTFTLQTEFLTFKAYLLFIEHQLIKNPSSTNSRNNAYLLMEDGVRKEIDQLFKIGEQFIIRSDDESGLSVSNFSEVLLLQYSLIKQELAKSFDPAKALIGESNYVDIFSNFLMNFNLRFDESFNEAKLKEILEIKDEVVEEPKVEVVEAVTEKVAEV